MADAGAPLPARGSTRMVGIIGWPVQESLSPLIHNAALAMDWAYVPLPVAPGDLEAALSGLPAMGFAGANVTMPHKTDAARLVDDLSEDAERLRAVNTLVVGPGGMAGHNTDAPGFDRFLRRDAGFDPEGSAALIFGAGGAARACALALTRDGLKDLTVAARDPTRAETVRATIEGLPLHQAALSFELWTGLEPPLSVMSAAALAEMAEAKPTG